MFVFSNQDQVLETCRDFGIRRLEVFGSTVRAPEAARDVDLLVE